MAPKATPTVDEKAVKQLIKDGVSIPKAAAQLKVSSSVMAGLYYKLEPVVFPKLKFTATPKAIVAARTEGLRWERIAARTGKSVSEVQEMFEKAPGKKPTYTGRGRRFDGSEPTTKAAASNGRKSGDKAASGKGGKAGAGKARTRAQRAAKASASPS